MIHAENVLWGLLVSVALFFAGRIIHRKRTERANRKRAERSLKDYVKSD